MEKFLYSLAMVILLIAAIYLSNNPIPYHKEIGKWLEKTFDPTYKGD